MDNQSVFDKIVGHLRKQGCKSQSGPADSYRCLYRGPKGTKCAAGCLIEDDEYLPEMESQKFNSLIRSSLGESLQRFSNNQDLICALQNIHDETSVSGWEFYFKQIAKDFNLTYR